MVGLSVYTRSVVLEKSLGMLWYPVLKEQFSRVVIYRIAIQVASAVHYLHNINIIHRDLNLNKVLLWSLSLKHLINCKVSGFVLATYAEPGGSRSIVSTKDHVAPEVSHVRYAKETVVYDHRVDIFDYGMLLYQLITCRNPFYNVRSDKIIEFIRKGQRPHLQDISRAETGLFYLTHVMKLCWSDRPINRPTAQKIKQWLCHPALQLIMSVKPIQSKYSISNACIITPSLNKNVLGSSELWICCSGVEGFELNIFSTNTMVEVKENFISDNQVRCMKQCGEYVWVVSQPITGKEGGVVSIFNQITKDLVHTMKIKANTVSCITNSDQLVYMGTMEGDCLAYHGATDNDIPCCKCISDHSIDGVVVTQTCLWVSAHNQIYFLNLKNLYLEGFQKRTKNTEALVGKMMLSDNEDQVWSAHVGGVIMSSWNSHQRVHLCDVVVSVIAEEKCHVGDPRDQIITAMCTGLDTVWIGLASGHIIVFGMNPPGEVLTYFRPYHSYVRFLSAINYPGPCEREKCMMLSGGKMYQPDDSFKELPDYPRKDRRGQPVDTSGVAILWEVIPAKYVRQLHYLRDGEAWSSYDSLQKAMIDTGFTESLKYCHPTPDNSSTAAVPHNDTPVNGTTDHQQVVKVQNFDTLHGDATMSTTLIHNDVTSQSKQLSVNLPSGEQLTLACEQPVTINSLTNKIAMIAEMKGDILITYKVDGKDIVTIKNDEQLEEYLCLSNRPNICVKLV